MSERAREAELLLYPKCNATRALAKNSAKEIETRLTYSASAATDGIPSRRKSMIHEVAFSTAPRASGAVQGVRMGFGMMTTIITTTTRFRGACG